MSLTRYKAEVFFYICVTYVSRICISCKCAFYMLVSDSLFLKIVCWLQII